jgi:glycosyltransferase involved in cell wall biosynthesis
MSDIDISIVVPVHNEEPQIAIFFAEICRVLGRERFEVLFVDDGSTDGTWNAVREAGSRDARAGGIRLSRNFGKEAALWSGLEAARGNAVVVMDVDFQHPPALLPRMIELWRAGGSKIVEAQKRRRGKEPFWYRGMSTLFYSILRSGTGQDFVGSTDFKLLDRAAVDVLKTLPERLTFFRGICAWTGLSRTSVEFEVPATGRPTRWSFLRLTKFSVDAITSFTPWPLFLVALAGVIFAAFSIVLGIDTLYMYFSGRAVTGFTTVILLTLIVGAAVMFGIAILGLYVSRLFDEVKARPRAVSVETITPEPRAVSVTAAAESPATV